IPGTTPPTSQLDWLSSTTAMIVLFWSRATRDLLKSFGWGIAATPSVRCSDEVATFPRRPPHSIFRFPVAKSSSEGSNANSSLRQTVTRRPCKCAQRGRFAPDSLLEGDGFERSVPGRGDHQTVMGDGTAVSKPERICWGTKGSNPPPSSGESYANLISRSGRGSGTNSPPHRAQLQ